jgi:hypothetical protein
MTTSAVPGSVFTATSDGPPEKQARISAHAPPRRPPVPVLLHSTRLHSLSICRHTKQMPLKSSSTASYSPTATLLNARLAMRAIMACTQPPPSATSANERCRLSHFPAMSSFCSVLAHRLAARQPPIHCWQQRKSLKKTVPGLVVVALYLVAEPE